MPWKWHEVLENGWNNPKQQTADIHATKVIRQGCKGFRAELQSRPAEADVARDRRHNYKQPFLVLQPWKKEERRRQERRQCYKRL